MCHRTEDLERVTPSLAAEWVERFISDLGRHLDRQKQRTDSLVSKPSKAKSLRASPG
jgi:hypothetical protein